MNKYDSMFIKIAHTVAEQSYAQRLKVGALVVKDDRIISMGYNGTYKGANNVCEEVVTLTEDGTPLEKTKEEVIHAEMNALMFVARSTESSVGTTLYCTHAPCENCAKHIIQAGVSKVIFNKKYRSDNGVKLLNRAGIEVYDLEHMGEKI